MDGKIIIRQEGAVAILTINEPKTLNALNRNILRELDKAFDVLAGDDSVRAVILTGTERSFVAGADIQEMADMDYERGKAFGEFGAALFLKIETFAKPVIAAVNGFALGGGCELAMACDIRIASEKARFGQPEVGLGITPGFSGTQRLSRLVGAAKAKELIYTGCIIGAEEAFRIGLVNKVTAPETLMEEAGTMAQAIAKQAPRAVSLSKKAINEGWDLPMADAVALEVEQFARCFETEDQKNGMKAFLNKEKVEFKGR